MHIQMLHLSQLKYVQLACYRDADGLCSAGRGWLLRLRPGDRLSSNCKPGSVDEYPVYKPRQSRACQNILIKETAFLDLVPL